MSLKLYYFIYIFSIEHCCIFVVGEYFICPTLRSGTHFNFYYQKIAFRIDCTGRADAQFFCDSWSFFCCEFGCVFGFICFATSFTRMFKDFNIMLSSKNMKKKPKNQNFSEIKSVILSFVQKCLLLIRYSIGSLILSYLAITRSGFKIILIFRLYWIDIFCQRFITAGILRLISEATVKNAVHYLMVEHFRQNGLQFCFLQSGPQVGNFVPVGTS